MIFQSATPAPSQLDYAEFTNGGASQPGMIVIDNSTVAMQHVMVSESATDGIYVSGPQASLTLSNANLTGPVGQLDAFGIKDNLAYGLHLVNQATVTVSNLKITGNDRFAIGQEAGTTLNGLTGIVSTGNGTAGTSNGVEMLSGGTLPAGTNFRWSAGPCSTLYTALTADFTVDANSTLTIDPGACVRVDPGVTLTVLGVLNANGADEGAGRIVFQPNPNAPAPVNWGSIAFVYSPGRTSTLSHVLLDRGGIPGNRNLNYDGAVFVNNADVLMDHVTIDHPLKKGISMSGDSGTSVVNLSTASLNAVSIDHAGDTGVLARGSRTALTLAASSISNGAGIGVDLQDRGAASLNGLSLTGNAGYALGAERNTSFTRLDAVVATGNGGAIDKNAIGYRGGIIDIDEVWLPGLPWVVTGDTTVHFKPNGGGRASLTMFHGINVRFAPGINLVVNGKLTASGIAPEFSVPITISFEGDSQLDRWGYIYFAAGSDPDSRIEKANITFSGAASSGAIYVSDSSPKLRDLIISNSTGAGIYALGKGAHPEIFNCSFIENNYGVYNADVGNPVNTIDARLNFWSDPDGPGNAAGFPRQRVSARVSYEPWLTQRSKPEMIQRIVAVSAHNRVLNPVYGINARLAVSTSLAGSWTAVITDENGVAKRHFSGTGPAFEIAWDGTDDVGTRLPDGNVTYTYEVASVAEGGDYRYTAIPVRGRMIVDAGGPAPAISTPSLTPATGYFNPKIVSAALSASSNYDLDFWSVAIYKDAFPGGTLVRTLTGQGQINAVWDGFDDGGSRARDGIYYLSTDYAVGSVSGQLPAVQLILDTTAPSASLDSPASGAVLSNVRGTASHDGQMAVVSVQGLADDANLSGWVLDFKPSGLPDDGTNTWSVLVGGATPVDHAEIKAWDTALLRENGSYQLRLRVTDRAGNNAESRSTVGVENFKVHMANEFDPKFNPSAAESEVYESTVPAFPVIETILIKRRVGGSYQLVRTLVDRQLRSAANCHSIVDRPGICFDAWDGKDDQGLAVPDGPYYFFAQAYEASAPANALDWDLSNTFHVDCFTAQTGFPCVGPYERVWKIPQARCKYGCATFDFGIDPYNNHPMSYQFETTQSRPVTVVFMTGSIPAEGQVSATELFSCDPPNYCVDLYPPSGVQELKWPGAGPDGRSWPVKHFRAVSRLNTWSYAAAVLYGNGAPVSVSAVRVSPNTLGDASEQPGFGSITVSYDLATFGGQAANVTLRIVHQKSGVVMRAIGLGALVPDGQRKSYVWDGNAGNGLPVAPGLYSVIIEAEANQGTSRDMTGLVVNY